MAGSGKGIAELPAVNVMKLSLLIPVALLFLAVNTQSSEAGWQCGNKRCFWKANYNGPLPEFAVGVGTARVAYLLLCT